MTKPVTNTGPVPDPAVVAEVAALPAVVAAQSVDPVQAAAGLQEVLTGRKDPPVLSPLAGQFLQVLQNPEFRKNLEAKNPVTKFLGSQLDPAVLLHNQTILAQALAEHFKAAKPETIAAHLKNHGQVAYLLQMVIWGRVKEQLQMGTPVSLQTVPVITPPSRPDELALPIFDWSDPKIVDAIGALPMNLRVLVLDAAYQCWLRSSSPLALLFHKRRQGLRVPADLAMAADRFQSLASQMVASIKKRPQVSNKAAAAFQPVEALLPEIKIEPLLKMVAPYVSADVFEATPSSGTQTALPDAGRKMGLVLLGFPHPEHGHWFDRLGLVQSYLQNYQAVDVLISVEGIHLPQLVRLLDANLSSSQKNRLHFATFPGTDEPTDAFWVRDGFMITQNNQGRSTVWVSKDLLLRCPNAAEALGQSVRGEVQSIPFKAYEGGQFLRGKDVVLIGIDMIAAQFDGMALSVENLRKTTQQMANWLGQKVIVVGDTLQGQALYHLDLYMTFLPDGTLAVSDFIAGLAYLESLGPDDFARWRADYLTRQSKVKTAGIISDELQKDAFLAVVGGLENRDGPLWLLLRKWAPTIQAKIDQETKRLEALGLKIKKIPAFGLPFMSGGLAANNVTIHPNEEEVQVLTAPSLSSDADAFIERAYRGAGFDGQVSFAPYMAHALLKNGGACRCLTLMTEGRLGERDNLFSMSWGETLAILNHVRSIWTKPLLINAGADETIESVLKKSSLTRDQQAGLREALQKPGLFRAIQGAMFIIGDSADNIEATVTRLTIEAHLIYQAASPPEAGRITQGMSVSMPYWASVISLASRLLIHKRQGVEAASLFMALHAYLDAILRMKEKMESNPAAYDGYMKPGDPLRSDSRQLGEPSRVVSIPGPESPEPSGKPGLKAHTHFSPVGSNRFLPAPAERHHLTAHTHFSYLHRHPVLNPRLAFGHNNALLTSHSANPLLPLTRNAARLFR